MLLVQRADGTRSCAVSCLLSPSFLQLDQIVPKVTTPGTRAQLTAVAFKVYDMDRDGFISNGELYLVLKQMVGNNLKDQQLQQIVDKTIMEADKDGDGKLSYEEFTEMVANTDIVKYVGLYIKRTLLRLGKEDGGRTGLADGRQMTLEDLF